MILNVAVFSYRRHLTHGSLDINKLSYKKFPLARELDKNDYVCILGDFGCVWNLDNEDNYWLDWLESRPFTTLFLPGNHENYSLLHSFPEEQWHDGIIRSLFIFVLRRHLIWPP